MPVNFACFHVVLPQKLFYLPGRRGGRSVDVSSKSHDTGMSTRLYMRLCSEVHISADTQPISSLFFLEDSSRVALSRVRKLEHFMNAL